MKSFAGITRPEGEPEALQASAAQLDGLSGVLGGAGSRLAGLPGTMTSWHGPASVAFVASALTNARAVAQVADAARVLATAQRQAAEALGRAQREAERAIEDAQDATRRIEAAEDAIEQARARRAAAVARAGEAAERMARTSALGGPPDAAAADLAQAEADAQDAAADEARARRRLEEARDDLRDAKRRGAEAEDDARQATHALASAAQAAGSVSPTIAMPAAAASAAVAGGSVSARVHVRPPDAGRDGRVQPPYRDPETGRVFTRGQRLNFLDPRSRGYRGYAEPPPDPNATGLPFDTLAAIVAELSGYNDAEHAQQAAAEGREGAAALHGIAALPGLGKLLKLAGKGAVEGVNIGSKATHGGSGPRRPGTSAPAPPTVPPPRQLVTTPRGRTFDIPAGWKPRSADNGRGVVYQRPGAQGNADSIRLMEPTPQYPRGYFRYYNERGQPLDVHGRPGPRGSTHIPEDFQGALPAWPR